MLKKRREKRSVFFSFSFKQEPEPERELAPSKMSRLRLIKGVFLSCITTYVMVVRFSHPSCVLCKSFQLFTLTSLLLCRPLASSFRGVLVLSASTVIQKLFGHVSSISDIL